MKAAIREKLEQRAAGVSFTDGAGPQTFPNASRGSGSTTAAAPSAYLTIPAIAAELGLEYAFVRDCFYKLPGIIRIGNGEGRRKKILVPRAVFEGWLMKNTVKEGGEGITYKRHRRTLAARRAKPIIGQGGYAVQ